MRIPYNWLKEYIDTKKTPKEAAMLLTSIGHALDKPIVEEHQDFVLDLEDRGNRSDTMSIVGIAREFAAATGEKLKFPKLSIIPTTQNENFKIKIESDRVLRWRAVIYKNVRASDSPKWLKLRLLAFGLEPKNTIIDITNYVMLELGMPTHAFDLDSFDEIILRQAKKGESLKTFDGGTLSFDENDLLASDSKKPLTLTTAVGGEESGITTSTKNVLFEAGLYDQPTARRSALRLNVRNETAARLGKYLHPQYCELALARIIYLMKSVCNLEPELSSFDYYPNKPEDRTIELTKERLDLLAGDTIGLGQAGKILESLEFLIEGVHNEKLIVKVPYFRTDVTMEEDVIEEILRIRGYNLIPSDLPQKPSPEVLAFPIMQLEEKLRDILVNLGLTEVIGLQIQDESQLKALNLVTSENYLVDNKSFKAVRLENSWNEELNTMRTELFTSLKGYAQTYLKHQATKISLFEIGKTFYQDPKKTGFDKYIEQRKAALLFLQKNSDQYTQFLSLKEAVFKALKQLGLDKLSIINAKHSLFKENISANVLCGTVSIGSIGIIKQKICSFSDLDGTTSYAELDLEQVSLLQDQSFLPKTLTSVKNFIIEDITYTLDEREEVGPFIEKLSKEFQDGTRVLLKNTPYKDATLSKEHKKKVTITVYKPNFT